MPKHLYISLFFFLGNSLSAQMPFFKVHGMSEQYQHAKVELIYEDHNSAIWVGSTEGLFLYDGIEFMPFVKEGITSNHVRSIFRDGQNRLWVGYEDGTIYHLVKQKLQPWVPEEGTPTVAVNGFSEDADGHIWISTYGEGVYLFDGKRLFNFNTDDGLLGNDIYEMTKDKDGKVWLGTDGGISICSFPEGEKKVKNITRSDGLPDEIVKAILPDNEGNMWIGMYDGGVCFFDKKEGKITQPLPNLPLGIINCLEIFEGTELWIGTSGNGAWRYSLLEKKLAPLPNFGGAKILDLHRDTEGNIWLVTNSHGVCSANRQFEFIKTDFENVQAILTDSKDRVWIGTSKGLFTHQLDGQGKSTFHQHLPQASLNIISLFEDRFGNIWIGTFGQGLYVYQPLTKAVRHFTEKDGIGNGNILSIDGLNGQVWLATLGGATKIENNSDVFNGSKPTFRNLDQQDGLGTNFIYKVFIDSQQRTWFGTDGEGISVLENGTMKNYPVAAHIHTGTDEEENPRLQKVYSITEDKSGNIWLSTDKAGIFAFDGENFSHLTVKEGIRDLEITSLATDANGQIIIVHPTGLDVLTPETGHLIYYDEEVGISDLDPNLNAICTDRFGNVWIGGKNSIIKYTALKEELEIHPRTLLNNVSVFLEPIDFQEINEFPYDQNSLVFNYMGLWYTDPLTVKYRYQLIGYDPNWINSKDRQANYSNLSPGHYTFRLTSTENDAWSDEPIVEYSFEVLFPFWMRWWFIGLSALSVGSLFYWYLKSRDKRLQRVNLLEKDRAESQLAALKAQINPHFLFNSFNTLVTVIEEDPKLAVEYVENLSDFYRKIMQLRDKEIISIQEEVELVKNYTYLLEKRYGGNFRLNIEVDGQPYFIVPLTLQLLVENAVKHNIISKNKPLSIEIKIENGEYITVTNNLQKKLTKEQSTSFGLHSLVQRYELLGKRKVKVEEKNGEFKISIPVIV